MIKPLHFFTLFSLIIGLGSKSYAQFPYVESFKNSSARGIIFGGSPSAFLTAAGNAYDSNSSTHTGTPIDQNGNGYLRLTTNQRNEKGYAISTSTFPSTNGLSVMFEYYIYGGNGADGISFFLFDATADPVNIGGFGGSLGYAQYTNTSPTSPGVSKGYLAIGLDEYGNFSNPTEGRQGGIPGLSPGSITLRGKGNGASTTPENYAYLTSAKIRDFGFDLIGSAGRIPNPTDQGYRKVYMDMAPNTNGGYNITVRITRGGVPQNTVTVISNYYYPEAAPVNLRYGFASSTGDQTNFHEIRNVNIDAYNTDGLTNPVAIDDFLSVCQGKTGVIDIVKNDTTSNPGANLVRASIDLNPSLVGIQSRFDVEGKGFFSLNSEGLVEFMPVNSFIGQVSCFYNIKDSFGRSSNAGMISLTYLAPPDQPNAGQDQLVNINSLTGTAVLQGSTIGNNNTGKWTRVSGPLTGTIISPLTSSTSVTNLQGGVYIFRWSTTSAGGCELYDDVQIIINHIPIAMNDLITIRVITSIEIPILNNDTDADGNSTLDPATIIFKTQPLHGTVQLNKVTGVVTYTATDNFNGTDTFSYSVKDVYGAESNIAIVSVSNNGRPIGQNDLVATTTNTPIIIKVLDNDPSKTGVTVTKDLDPTNGTILINPDGTIAYTPKPGFSGKDSFTYLLKTNENLVSDPITVNVNVTPVGSPDNVTTPLNRPLTILIKDNDLSKIGTTVILGPKPLNGTINLDALGNVLYTPNRGYIGIDNFTYTLQTADGLISPSIAVTVTVTPIVLPVPPDFNVTVPINQPLTIDVPIPAGTTVVVTDSPKHGTITFDPVTGKPIYTPTPGYSGPDDFSYIIRDADGNESIPGKVTLTLFIPAKIGLAKSLKSAPTKNLDGTFDLTYLFTLINYGEVAINRVSLTDDILSVFSGNTIKVNQVTATGSLVANSSYNGTSVKDLLTSGSTLTKLSKEYVEVSITVALDKQEGTFNNTAYTEGYSASDASKVSDVSTNGLNPDPGTPADVSPSEVTPVKILRQELFVPGGFSPNNDGINDYFVIENTQGKKIDLEVYNRWGNLIHKSKTYQNDWAGKTTEGIHLGDDVPTGTYYYIIKIDGKDKRVGYITINR
jgi:gliding motility-associated-like protein